jgi:hypothetical protein
MTTNCVSFGDLADRDLLATIRQLAVDERHATALLIASLAELDARQLYLAEGYSSLFTYCTQALHLSEHAAYGRIQAARAARAYPLVLERLEAGDITLTTIGLLSPHLTPDNHRQLLEATRHKSKREVEHLVATLRPQPPVPPVTRKLPDRSPARVEASTSAPHPATALTDLATPASTSNSRTPGREAKPAVVKPVDAERYKVQFTVNRDTLEKLRYVQDLMRHTCPNGDIAIVFERALTMLLEFHHVLPFADGGTAVVENIQLRCRAHNQYESEQWFGAARPVVVRERFDCSSSLVTRSGSGPS